MNVECIKLIFLHIKLNLKFRSIQRKSGVNEKTLNIRVTTLFPLN